MRLGDEAEQRAVAVEAPGPPDLDDLEPGFVVTVQQLVGDLAGRRLVGQLQRFGAEPLHADHRDEAVGQNAAHGGIGPEVFELHALLLFFHHVHLAGSAPMWLHGVAMPPVFVRSMIAGRGLKAAACMTKRSPCRYRPIPGVRMARLLCSRDPYGLSRILASRETTASISSPLVPFPRLNRTAPMPTCSGTRIAASTGESSTRPA